MDAVILVKQYVVFWATEKRQIFDKKKSFLCPQFFSIAQNRAPFSPKHCKNIQCMCTHLLEKIVIFYIQKYIF